jgi:hypothetical protein
VSQDGSPSLACASRSASQFGRASAARATSSSSRPIALSPRLRPGSAPSTGLEGQSARRRDRRSIRRRSRRRFATFASPSAAPQRRSRLLGPRRCMASNVQEPKDAPRRLVLNLPTRPRHAWDDGGPARARWNASGCDETRPPRSAHRSRWTSRAQRPIASSRQQTATTCLWCSRAAGRIQSRHSVRIRASDGRRCAGGRARPGTTRNSKVRRAAC